MLNLHCTFLSFIVVRVSLELGSVVDGSYGDFWWSANKSSIYLLLHVSSTGLSTVQDGDHVSYDVTVTYSGQTIVKPIHFTYEVDPPLISSADQAVEVDDVTTDTGTNLGEVFETKLQIKTSGRSIADYAVEAAVSEDSPLASECNLSTRALYM